MFTVKKTAMVCCLFLATMVLFAFSACDDGGGGGSSSVPDITAPEVVTVYPDDNDTDIPINDNITVQFSENIDEDSCAGAITMADTFGDITGAVTCENNMVTFDPGANLVEFMDHTVTVSTDILDLAGNALEEEYTWSFETGSMVNTNAPEPGDEGALTVEKTYSRKADLTWTKASDDITHASRLQYRVYLSTAEGAMDSPEEIDDGVTAGTVIAAAGPSYDIESATAEDLDPDTLYYFNVVASDAAGNRAVYETVNAATVALPPEVQMSQSSGDNNSITLNWTGLAAGNHVEIDWGIEGNTPSTETAAAGALTCAIGSLAENTEYAFVLRTLDADGNVSEGISFHLTTAKLSTPKTYYFIYTATDLDNVRNGPLYDYIVMADIDLSDYAAGAGFEPIGGSPSSTTTSFAGAKFLGSFDGNGFTISNLKINRPSEYYVGLFAFVDTYTSVSTYLPGTVKNLTLESDGVAGKGYVGTLAGYSGGSAINCAVSVTLPADVTGTDAYTGGVVGMTYTGSASGSSFTGTVIGTSYVGGFAGQNDTGPMSACSASGSVTGSGDYVGGLVGSNYNQSTDPEQSRLTDCTTAATVTAGGDYAGGLAGQSTTSSITGCHATGNISASGSGSYMGGLIGSGSGSVEGCSAAGGVQGAGWYFGGLIGTGSGPFENCQASGNVTVSGSGRYTGGFIGYGGELSDCHATGAVTGVYYTGGLAGYASGNTSNCSATGDVSGQGTVNITYTGGLAGYIAGNTSDCYASGDVNTIRSSAGGLAGCINSGVTVSDCRYETGTVSGSTSSENVGGLAGENYGTIDECFSTGAVSGVNYYIGGLVGTNNGTIENSHAAGAVSNTSNFTGGLVARNYGGISLSYFSGTVTGVNYVGGLAGVSYYDTSITLSYSAGNVNATGGIAGGLVGENYGSLTKCYSTADVACSYTAGGLVGWNLGESVTITDCFAMGDITASASDANNLGGLVGINYNSSEVSLTRCYAAGAVPVIATSGGLAGANGSGSTVTVTDCYYDYQTTGQSSTDGNARTTAQMQDQDNYIDWDFTAGTGVWTINGGYPALRELQ